MIFQGARLTVWALVINITTGFGMSVIPHRSTVKSSPLTCGFIMPWPRKRKWAQEQPGVAITRAENVNPSVVYLLTHHVGGTEYVLIWYSTNSSKPTVSTTKYTAKAKRLVISTTNKNLEVIAQYYLDTVRQNGGAPQKSDQIMYLKTA